jgi:hypothetical protein
MGETELLGRDPLALAQALEVEGAVLTRLELPLGSVIEGIRHLCAFQLVSWI